MKHVGAYAAFFVLYLAFAGSVSGEGLVSATLLAGLAVTAAAAIRTVTRRPIAFVRADVAAWLRAVGKIPGDTARIGGALLRVAATGESVGRGVRAPFRFGEVDDARERGRRATAVIAGSLTPDTIVMHVAPGRDAVCHRLLTTSNPDQPERLV